MNVEVVGDAAVDARMEMLPDECVEDEAKKQGEGECDSPFFSRCVWCISLFRSPFSLPKGRGEGRAGRIAAAVAAARPPHHLS